MIRLPGVAASRGICIGPVFKFIRTELVVEKKIAANSQTENKRLETAIEKAKSQINIFMKSEERGSTG